MRAAAVVTQAIRGDPVPGSLAASAGGGAALALPAGMRRARWCWAGAMLALAVLIASRGARAEDIAPAKAPFEWSADWPRFRWWEYGASAAFGAASLYFYRYEPPPATAKWQGTNAFDDTIRDWLRARTPAGRARAARASDYLWWGGTAVPYVVDLPVALFARRSPQVTWQLLMMDLEANAIAGFVNYSLFYVVGRGRPSYGNCATDPSYDPLCGGNGNNASLPSGHTLGIATAAGLTCVHHHYLPLYGTPAADASACAVMAAATLATGITRIIADRHYASDVLLGAAIGFGSGYGFPWLLHYRHRSAGAGGEASPPRSTPVAVLPLVGPNGLGLGLFGAL